jgi:ATP synthase protein I
MTKNTSLKQQIERQAKRMKKAEEDRPTLLAQTAFVGTLGLLIVIPIVIGAYLGQWLDTQLAGYSIHWTTSLIILGVIIGAINVYLFIKDE